MMVVTEFYHSLLYLVESCSGVWSTFDLLLSCDSTDMRSFVSVNMASYRSLFGNVILLLTTRTGSLLVPSHRL